MKCLRPNSRDSRYPRCGRAYRLIRDVRRTVHDNPQRLRTDSKSHLRVTRQADLQNGESIRSSTITSVDEHDEIFALRKPSSARTSNLSETSAFFDRGLSFAVIFESELFRCWMEDFAYHSAVGRAESVRRCTIGAFRTTFVHRVHEFLPSLLSSMFRPVAPQ